MKEVDSTSLQATLQDLETAYQNFFRYVKQGEKPGYPRFKSKRDHRQSYKSKCVGTNIKVLNKAVQLPKLGRVKCRISKEVQGRILSATVFCNPRGRCWPRYGHQVFCGIFGRYGIPQPQALVQVREETGPPPAAVLPKNKGEQAQGEGTGQSGPAA